MEHITHITRQVPRHIVYGRNLRNKEDACIELKPGVLALLNCNEDGKLLKKYVIAEYRYSQESQEIFSICSCGDNTCLHIREFHSQLGPAEDYITEQTEDYVCEFLSESLVGVYCQIKQSYGVHIFLLGAQLALLAEICVSQQKKSWDIF